MLEFFAISISTILGFFIPALEAVSEFPQTAFSYGSVAEQVSPPDSNQPVVTSLLFTGDIMLARNVEQLMKDYGPSRLSIKPTAVMPQAAIKPAHKYSPVSIK